MLEHAWRLVNTGYAVAGAGHDGEVLACAARRIQHERVSWQSLHQALNPVALQV